MVYLINEVICLLLGLKSLMFLAPRTGHNLLALISVRDRHIPYTEVAYTNCLTGSLNIYTGKTPVSNFSALFSHLSVDRKLYYNSSLFLNKSIDPTNIGL